MTAREDTTELLTRYYAAFNARDDEALLACLSENVIHDINQGERETGKEAFRQFLVSTGNAYRERLDEIAIMTSEDGTRAAVEFIVHGEYRESQEGFPAAQGQLYTLPAGAFFEVPDGAISRVSVYYNLADWVAQVSVANQENA